MRKRIALVGVAGVSSLLLTVAGCGSSSNGGSQGGEDAESDAAGSSSGGSSSGASSSGSSSGASSGGSSSGASSGGSSSGGSSSGSNADGGTDGGDATVQSTDGGDATVESTDGGGADAHDATVSVESGTAEAGSEASTGSVGGVGGEGGTVASYCGAWTSLSSSTGGETMVGESILLTAAATGLDTANLGYTWTMSNPIGAFGATTNGVGSQGQDEAAGASDIMQFMCTAPGTTTVTLVVDDGPLPDGGACSSSLSTTTATVICDPYPSSQVESAWVELTGPNGLNGYTGNVAIARALTAYVPTEAGANPCPTITINSGAPVQMNLRAAATTSIAARTVNTAPGITSAAIIGGAAAGGPGKPALVPVSSCEYPLPSGATSATVAGRSLPVPKANPTKIVVIGDTGCRLQSDNGTQSCNDPNPNGTDTPYPFAAIATAAAAQSPDLVLHVGDYAYRDTECPAGLGFNCGGSPWGFGWDTWEADLFVPGAPLLAAAPWVMTRGNHEQCNRAGQGWYRFLDTQPFDTAGVHTCDNPAYDDPGPLSSSTTADTTCANYGVYGNCSGNWNNPFLVQINPSTQIVVFDTANAKPQSQGLNSAFSALPTGSTSLPTNASSLFFATYASELTTAGCLVGATSGTGCGSPLPFNFWSNHHPIFGYATGNPPANPIPAFLPVMNHVFPGTYFPPPINLAMHGHTHDYQAINFQTGTQADGGGTFQPAATLVSGNAGDILDTQLPYPLTDAAVSSVGNPTAVSIGTSDAGVQQFATSDNGTPYQNPISDAAVAAGDTPSDNGFGYLVLQFNPGDGGTAATWTSTEYRTDNTIRDICTIQASGQMSCTSWGIVQPDDAGV